MHTLTAHAYVSLDPRLKRRILHDSRSLFFAYPEDASAIASVRHSSFIASLDQGQVGSCTANAAIKVLTYGDTFGDTMKPNIGSLSLAAVESQIVLPFYSDEETADGDGPYPPNDQGSTGLTAAKVAMARGWISGYQHALSLTAVLTALSKQPVIVGTEFTADMESPSPAGEIVPTGKVMGGHEYVLDQLDVENQRVWMQNSWSDSWGQGGRAWMSYATLQKLLSAQGDCTVFTPLSQPAPEPTPDPAPVGALATFEGKAKTWLSTKHTGDNAVFAKATQAYLASV